MLGLGVLKQAINCARALNLVVSTQQEGQTRLQGLCAGKSIGATSQAFHEPMSTGAFLEFLTRLGCRDEGSGACWPGPQGLGAEMLAHGTVKLRFGNHPTPPKVWEWRDRPQRPVSQVSRKLGAPGPQGLGPGPPGGLGPRRGCQLKTKPGYPPYPHFGAVRERKRVKNAFGNHPTRPPRSADPKTS